MQRLMNISSFVMMTIVLLLGMVMPSLPNLDDGDDNVGCAAVLVAPTKSDGNVCAARRRKQSIAATVQGASASATPNRFAEVNVFASASKSHVSPPLRT